ncbi:MAG: AAA family ATPase [Desulfovibrio sp.]|jgi:hypothetical protein|nr:AAA family ATPase [Desulfovibrio sp.]
MKLFEYSQQTSGVLDQRYRALLSHWCARKNTYRRSHESIPQSPPPPLPIGIDDFTTIRRGGYVYVDKTDIIADLLGGRPPRCAFNRPSGFGTLLMLSTIETLYAGDRSLFNGLAIEKRLDEEPFLPHPVIYLDMGKLTNVRSYDDIDEQMSPQLLAIAERNEVNLRREYHSFHSLLAGVINAIEFKWKQENKTDDRRCIIVILDKHDKPLLDVLDSPDVFDDIHKRLNSIFCLLKARSESVYKLFACGLCRYTTKEFWSSYELPEIEYDPRFACLCGFTHKDLESHPLLDQYIKNLGNNLSPDAPLDKKSTIAKLKKMYGGYAFDGQQSSIVANPDSVLRCLDAADLMISG